MTRGAALALALAVAAACFGAALQQSRTTAPAGGRQESAEPVPIDPREVVPLAPVRPAKDAGERALAHARVLCELGPRHTGQPGWHAQLEYLERHLRGLGLAVARDTWTDRKELLTFTNLSVTIPGRVPERIVVAAHHDTKCTSGHPDAEHNFRFVGANDGASGVAVLLELAAHLQRHPPTATVQIVFFDGEESLDWAWNEAARALFGSKRFVKQHRDRLLLDPAAEPRIAALVLLDMVGRTDLHIQEELFSTPRLRTLLWSAAVALGVQDRVFRRAETASDDHRPFLDVGIPAVDLIDLAGNPHWHKPTDTIENLSAASLETSLALVLTLLPAVEREFVLAKPTDAETRPR